MRNRKKEILFWLVSLLITLPVTYVLENLYITRFKMPYTLIWFALVMFIAYNSYTEAKNDDPLIDGKEQKQGMSNSFTNAAVMVIVLSSDVKSWILVAILMSGILYTARWLGRNSSKNSRNSLQGKVGEMITNSGSNGVAIIENKKIPVCCNTNLLAGDYIKVSEIKSGDIFVEKM